MNEEQEEVDKVRVSKPPKGAVDEFGNDEFQKMGLRLVAQSDFSPGDVVVRESALLSFFENEELAKKAFMEDAAWRLVDASLKLKSLTLDLLKEKMPDGNFVFNYDFVKMDGLDKKALSKLNRQHKTEKRHHIAAFFRFIKAYGLFGKTSDADLGKCVFGALCMKKICFANHSCVPNCVLNLSHVDKATRKLTFSLIARMPIKKGEEITYSYIPFSRIRLNDNFKGKQKEEPVDFSAMVDIEMLVKLKERQNILEKTFGFKCKCDYCFYEAAKSIDSIVADFSEKKEKEKVEQKDNTTTAPHLLSEVNSFDENEE